MVRNDIPIVEDMVDEINDLTNKENDTYVAVGEYDFNSDTLRNVRLPEVLDAVPSMCYVSDVDLRDGFPKHFLTAGYVFGCNSENCTYNNGEKILRYINENIVDKESAIGKHYELLSSYQLENRLTIDLYKRTSDYSEDDLQAIADYFDSIYPGRDELFKDRILGE